MATHDGAVLNPVSRCTTPFVVLRMEESITHLQSASADLDRLSADGRDWLSLPTGYRLHEASHAIHRALLALTECLEAANMERAR
jgi:hypothetical protein